MGLGLTSAGRVAPKLVNPSCDARETGAVSLR